MLVKMGSSSPRIGMKIKNIWNDHLVWILSWIYVSKVHHLKDSFGDVRNLIAMPICVKPKGMRQTAASWMGLYVIDACRFFCQKTKNNLIVNYWRCLPGNTFEFLMVFCDTFLFKLAVCGKWQWTLSLLYMLRTLNNHLYMVVSIGWFWPNYNISPT